MWMLSDSFSAEFLFQDLCCTSWRRLNRCTSADFALIFCGFRVLPMQLPFQWSGETSLPSATNPFIFFVHLPFSGKINTIVGFPWLCPRSVKESLAWSLHWYGSNQAGLPGGFQWYRPGRVPGPHVPAELLVCTSHPRRSCRVLERQICQPSCSARVYGKRRGA